MEYYHFLTHIPERTLEWKLSKKKSEQLRIGTMYCSYSFKPKIPGGQLLEETTPSPESWDWDTLIP